MTTIFKDCSKTMIKNFRTFAESGKPVEVLRVYRGYTMDVIASSAFSTKIDSFNDPDNEFVKKAKLAILGGSTWRFLLLFLCPNLSRLLGIAIAPPSATRFFCKLIREIIEERQRTGQTRNDFLQMLLDTAKEVEEQETAEKTGEETRDITENYGDNENLGDVFKANFSKKHLSFKELVSQSVIFFLAGFEGIAGTLSYATYLLALNEDVQEKVIKEVDQALQEHKGELTYEAIQSFKYMDNVISETLRLYPPGIRSERVADADYKLGETGITIPKGMIVTVPIYAIHRDPNFYPDPDKFDPERFNASERAKRNPYAYLPFGAGPRNCVGMRFALMEVKLCLANLMSNFRIKRCSETKVPLEFNCGQAFLCPKDVTLMMQLRTDCK